MMADRQLQHERKHRRRQQGEQGQQAQQGAAVGLAEAGAASAAGSRGQLLACSMEMVSSSSRSRAEKSSASRTVVPALCTSCCSTYLHGDTCKMHAMLLSFNMTAAESWRKA